MSSFFLPAKSKDRKRQKKPKPASVKRTSSAPKRPKLDEEIPSDSESDSDDVRGRRHEQGNQLEEDVLEETAQEKKLRLAKEYLARLESEEVEKAEFAEQSKDAISHRLQQDVLEQRGQLVRNMANTYLEPTRDAIQYFRGHKLSLTCVTATPKSGIIFTGGKDCTIIKWDLHTGKKLCIISGHRASTDPLPGHRGHVLALAVTSDGKYLASGGANKMIYIWDVDSCTHLHTFRGHKAAVTGVVFRYDSHQLFSCSTDRTVKLWSVDEMAYIETLFGHLDPITSIDCLHRERPITSGGFDKSIRSWKIIEESQLVYQGHRASIDCVCLLNEDHFISGSQDGTIALWQLAKKKPLTYKPHNDKARNVSTCVSEEWVTAVSALPLSDLVASGSSDGFIRFWKCALDKKLLQPIFKVPVAGFVNGLCFTACGDYLLAAVGQEHRLGRWWCLKEAKNRLVIIKLSQGDNPTSTLDSNV